MIEITFEKSTVRFHIEDLSSFKRKAFAWSNQFDVVSYLDSNNYQNDSYGKYEALLAVGVESEILPSTNSFEELKGFHEEKKDWLFGFLSYDLKNEIEDLESNNFDGINLPHLHFFQPKIVIEFFQKEIKIHSKEENLSLIHI